MKILFKIVIYLLALIGAITVALAAYLYLADPFNLRELMAPNYSSTPPTSEQTAPSTNQYDLSPAQILFLEKVGIDPSKLPTDISPELEDCLTNAVGEERAQQIKAGAVPTPADLLKAKTCL